MPEWLYKYIHKINIKIDVQINIQNKNKNKLLVINNIKDFDIFNKKYGTKYQKDAVLGKFISNKIPNILYSYMINWKKVSYDYGGIEICPFLWKRKGYSWYSSWDVGSGCIWNIKSIIKNTELIYEKKNGKYIKTNN